MIRPATTNDAEQIASLYNYYVEKTTVTFEEDSLPASEVARRITAVMLDNPWLVAEQQGSITGYAYAAPFETRTSYRHSVETSIYLAKNKIRQGLGTDLYAALIENLRNCDRHCAIGRIALPNDASIALHEKLGFTKVAQLNEIGYKFEQWIDVGYWELLL
jgi:phosphinothricin acetyltransferase